MTRVWMVVAVLVLGCSKGGDATSSAGSAGSAGSAVAASSAWAAGAPASIPKEAITDLDALTAMLDRRAADIAGSDCAKSIAAIEEITPINKRLSEIADKLDAISTSDKAALDWLTATYNPHLKVEMDRISAAMKNVECRSNDAWKKAVMAWLDAMGFKPQ